MIDEPPITSQRSRRTALSCWRWHQFLRTVATRGVVLLQVRSGRDAASSSQQQGGRDDGRGRPAVAAAAAATTASPSPSHERQAYEGATAAARGADQVCGGTSRAPPAAPLVRGGGRAERAGRALLHAPPQAPTRFGYIGQETRRFWWNRETSHVLATANARGAPSTSIF